MTTGGEAELLYKNLNVSRDWTYPPEVLGPNAEAFSILVTLIHPVSRGSVTLKSTDSQVHPVIQPNYLMDDVDLKTLLAGCKIAMKILQQVRDLGYRHVDSVVYMTVYFRCALFYLIQFLYGNQPNFFRQMLTGSNEGHFWSSLLPAEVVGETQQQF